MKICVDVSFHSRSSWLPATAEIDISNSILENGGQTNVEGTMLDFPPSDPAQANQARVSVNITGSTIRNAGAVAGFESASNILLVSSRVTAEPVPFTHGRYSMTVQNSTIEGSKRHGIKRRRTGRRRERFRHHAPRKYNCREWLGGAGVPCPEYLS